MSISLTSSQLAGLSAAAKAAATTAASSSQSANTANATSASAAGSSSSSADTSSAALSSLSSNFNDFLTLLTAQLQNQDPTTPMDSSQFTTELVQFTGVQQQVQTNTNLTQLIQLSQEQELAQSSALVGKSVVITGNTVPLQNSSAQVNFNTVQAEPVSISVTDAAGQDVKDVQFTSTVGSNSWSWNGTDNEGNQLPDGAYNIAIEGADATGNPSAITFTSTGTPTSVQSSGSGLTVSFGPTVLNYADVQSVTP